MQNTHYSSQILMTLELSTKDFSKNIQTSNFIKIRPVAAELLHEDGHTSGQTRRS